MVEEQLAEIPRLHPAVSRVVPTRQRVWRRRPFAADTWREIGAMRRAITEARYDGVIDAQGLIRTAALSRLAAGPHCGYDARSVREPPASLFYDRKYPVSVTIHAVERMRRLVAQAMGYEPPAELDYGVRIAGVRPDWLGEGPYLVGLHATARPDKAWDEAGWAQLARLASEQGLAIVLPWGNEGELERSRRLAAAAARAVVPPNLNFTEMAGVLAGAAAVAGVDTGLTHLASAVGAPVVAIYVASWSEFNGVVGPAFVANLGGPGAPPSVEAVWTELRAAMKAGRCSGVWKPAPADPSPELASRRRFRPSNARAVVHRR
jgi:heptosyltransferase-1